MVDYERKIEERENFKPYTNYNGFKAMGEDSFFWGKKHFISGRDKISIGKNVHIGNNAWIRGEGGIEIGDNTHISRNLVLYTINHDYNGSTIPYDDNFIEKPVKIGKNVWIGMNVCIAPGTEIGDGCIIGMGTTVSGKIPPLSIVTAPKCIVVKNRDEEHYNYMEKTHRYGGSNGVLYKREMGKILENVGDTYLSRRSVTTIVENNGVRMIRKEFIPTREAMEAFQTERDFLQHFQLYKWCPIVYEVGDNFIVTEYFDNEFRLDKIKDTTTETLGKILWNLYEIFLAGYAHRDFHSRNIFIINGEIKFIDFESVGKLKEGSSFWDSYDIIGEGLESPFLTGRMCVLNQESDITIGKVFGVNIVEELKKIFEDDLKKRMFDASITFKTLRDGMERHTLRNPKIYATFDLPRIKVTKDEGQRDTFKRFQQFGINREIIEDKKVLDIGSNIGATLLNLYKFNPQKMVGLEYDQDKVDISNKLALYNNISNVQFLRFDIEKDSFDSTEKFDVVFCLAVVEHIKNKKKLFDLLGEVTTKILYFEGNANSKVEYLTNSLLSVGFNDIKYLGFCNDDANPSNNNRPVFIARK